ncbi:MAG: hypothetical protein FJ265_09850 [Planctomycetes bacterium]|nr:hypothetical protein [Planctomycetota bacterium]
MAQLTPADLAAINLLRQAMKDNFRKTFTGASFVPKGEQLAQAAGEATDAVVEIVDNVCGEIVSIQGYESFKKGFTAVAQPGPFLMTVLQKLTGMDDGKSILEAIGPHTLAGFFEAVAPFYGVIGSGVATVKHFYKAIDDLTKSWAGQEALPAVQAGAPEKALASVAVLLKRRSNDHFAQGAVKAVETAVNGALIGSGIASAASTGVSLGAKIATLAVIIRRRVLEYKEVQKGKQALGNAADLTPKVFEACPLLGCYLLTNSNTSDLVMSCFAQGTVTPDWQKQVEKNKKQIDPLIAAAREFIGESLFLCKGPGITTRATAKDNRPWIERFWIGRYGATGKGYRVIAGGKKVVAKVEVVKDVATDTLRTAYKKTLELMLEGKQEGK